MDTSTLTGPPELATRLQNRPLVMVVARNSSQGSKARSYAADELVKAIDGLAAQTGLNFAAHLPTPETLRARIKSAPVLKSTTADGLEFSHKIITIDDALDAGLVIVIGTGTGRKTDDAGAQPFVAHLVEEIRSRKPALIFANRFDRFLRSTGAAMLLYDVCEGHDVLMGDAQDGIHPGGDMAQVLNFFKAFSAEREAKGIPVKTRQAMVLKSGRVMENGKVEFAAQTSPPPGLARIRLKSASGGIGGSYLFLDSPQFYPPADEVAGGLPAVKRGGQPVDQVALVCWALENLGKPGHTKSSVGRELAKRGFSTAKYRDIHGADASYPAHVDASRAYLPLRSIMENLEFYETGTFQVNVGGGADNAFQVTKCVPPRGYWAKPADFARIRSYIATRPKKAGYCLMSLVGVPITVDGIHGLLAASEDGHYKVRYPAKDGKRRMRKMPHKVLADVIAEGLMEAAGQVFIPLVPKDSPEVSQMRAEAEKAEADAAKAERRAAVMRNQLLEVDEDGEPILPATVRRELGVELETLLVSAETARVKAGSLARQVSRATEASSASGGVPVNRLLVLLESLRDPGRVEYNLEWKTTLSFDFHTRLNNHNGLRDHWVEICGTLRIRHEDVSFDVPLNGKYQSPTWGNPTPRAQVIVDEMLTGVPYKETSAGMKVELRPRVAALFGVEPAYFSLSTCPNGRITRVGATCLAHPSWTAAKVASRLGEPVALVQAVKARLALPVRNKSWLRTRSPIIAAFAQLAAAGDGRVTTDQVACVIESAPQAWFKLKDRPEGKAWRRVSVGVYELKPCKACGHRVRYANRLHGVTGWVCQACRTDDAGVVWDRDIDEWRY